MSLLGQFCHEKSCFKMNQVKLPTFIQLRIVFWQAEMCLLSFKLKVCECISVRCPLGDHTYMKELSLEDFLNSFYKVTDTVPLTKFSS